MDVDNLGPAPDLDAIDFTKLDMGNTLDEPKGEPQEDPKDEPQEEPKEAPAEEPKEEPEEEPEEEESKGEPERDESGKFKAKDVKIPKQRFDEAVAKEREAREAAEKRAADLEARLQQRERQQAQEATNTAKISELDAKASELQKKHAEHLLDGDAEKAASVMSEIRQIDRQIARIETQAESSTAVSQQLEEERFTLAVAKLEADHPLLNPKSEDYDPDLVEMILGVHAKMVNNGSTPSQALYDATEKVMKRFAQPAKEEPKEGLGKAEKEDRQKKAVEQSLDAQKRQPSPMKDVGMDSDKMGEKGLPDVSKMSVEEYDALPETTKARLRGDLV